MDGPADLTSKDVTRCYPVDGGEATHNRSVAGPSGRLSTGLSSTRQGRPADFRFSGDRVAASGGLNGWVKLDLSASVQSARLVSLDVAVSLQAERRR
jgi:hypothetical protein